MITTTQGAPLTIDMLRDAVEDDAAIRYRARLQPAGGPGDKVFPPTYAGGIYAIEFLSCKSEPLEI